MSKLWRNIGITLLLSVKRGLILSIDNTNALYHPNQRFLDPFSTKNIDYKQNSSVKGSDSIKDGRDYDSNYNRGVSHNKNKSNKRGFSDSISGHRQIPPYEDDDSGIGSENDNPRYNDKSTYVVPHEIDDEKRNSEQIASQKSTKEDAATSCSKTKGIFGYLLISKLKLWVYKLKSWIYKHEVKLAPCFLMLGTMIFKNSAEIDPFLLSFCLLIIFFQIINHFTTLSRKILVLFFPIYGTLCFSGILYARCIIYL